MTTDKDGRSLRAGLSSLRDEAAQEASSPKASIPIAELRELITATRGILAEALAPVLEYRTPLGYRDDAYNQGPALLDSNGKVIAAFFWPCHLPEHTDAAVDAAEHLFALLSAAPDILRRFCDLTDAVLAQGIEALGGDPQGAPSRSDESPVGNADAPKESAP